MPTKFVAKTVGRRLTQARPESIASCSTSLLRSPRYRDGCRETSSSALIAERATSLATPASRHRATTSVMAGPSAREFRKTADAPCSASAIEPYAATPAGKPALCGVRLTARTAAPTAASSATSGRPTLPVAPVITMVMFSFLRVIGALHIKDEPEAPKVTVGVGNFSSPHTVDES